MSILLAIAAGSMSMIDVISEADNATAGIEQTDLITEQADTHLSVSTPATDPLVDRDWSPTQIH